MGVSYRLSRNTRVWLPSWLPLWLAIPVWVFGAALWLMVAVVGLLVMLLVMLLVVWPARLLRRLVG